MNAIKSFFRKIENKAKFYVFVFSLWRNPRARPMAKAVMRTYRKAQKFARHVRKIGPSVYAAEATGHELEYFAAMCDVIRGIGESDDSLRKRVIDALKPRSGAPAWCSNGEAEE